MRLITLNIWGARHHNKILNFVKNHSKDTDIFCFQEVFSSEKAQKTPNGSWSNSLEEFKDSLPGFDFYFSPVFHNRDYDQDVEYTLSQGQATFWRKNLDLKEKGQIFVHRKENDWGWFPGGKMDPPRSFQYLVFNKFLVINLHGYWEPAPKHDTPERFKQSQMILDVIKKYNLPSIIAGDFNLRIDTKALHMFEEMELRNLVKESGAKTTRSSLYDIKWRASDPYADYIIVSKNLAVYDFKVLPDEISDHLPLYLKFEI